MTTTPLIIVDRVREITTGTGTGNLTLAGAVSGYRAFSLAIANGLPFPYSIKHQSNTEFEEGIGELSGGTTLIRRVTASSNGDNLVNFSAGTKDVVLTRHAAIIGDFCKWGTGEDGALVITASNVTPTAGEDAHYTSVSWGVGATGILTLEGGILNVLDTLDLTNCPAGGIQAATNVSVVWGTVGCGGRGGVGNPSDPVLASATKLAARLGGDGGGAAGGGATGGGNGFGRIPAFTSLAGIPGGAGGAGAAAASPGSGGTGGGVLEIRARRINRSGATAAGAILAAGQSGASGASNGGGGGGGGRIRVIYGFLLGSTKTGALSAPGGNGGAGGVNSRGGEGGVIERINVTAATHTLTSGTSTGTITGGSCTADL